MRAADKKAGGGGSVRCSDAREHACQRDQNPHRNEEGKLIMTIEAEVATKVGRRQPRGHAEHENRVLRRTTGKRSHRAAHGSFRSGDPDSHRTTRLDRREDFEIQRGFRRIQHQNPLSILRGNIPNGYSIPPPRKMTNHLLIVLVAVPPWEPLPPNAQQGPP